jgi:UPF0716 family protein affecting phage T7 exclusion
MEALGFNIPGLITQLVSFLILFALLYRLLYKPVLRMLDQRAARIQRRVGPVSGGDAETDRGCPGRGTADDRPGP